MADKLIHVGYPILKDVGGAFYVSISCDGGATWSDVEWMISNDFVVTMTGPECILKIWHLFYDCDPTFIKLESTLCECPTVTAEVQVSCDKDVNKLVLTKSADGVFCSAVIGYRFGAEAQWQEIYLTSIQPITEIPFFGDPYDVQMYLRVNCCGERGEIMCIAPHTITNVTPCQTPCTQVAIQTVEVNGNPYEPYVDITWSHSEPADIYTVKFFPDMDDTTNYYVEQTNNNSVRIYLDTAAKVGAWKAIVQSKCGKDEKGMESE